MTLRTLRFALLLAAIPAASTVLKAQSPASANILVATVSPAESSSATALPDAPSPLAALPPAVSAPDQGKPNLGAHTAPRYASYIASDEVAQPITGHDKAIIGLHNTYALTSLLGIIASAGYSQVLNGQPNYGTDRGAFGQRLGASAIRSTSDSLFTDAVFAPLLRDDPRYYVQGGGHSFVHRTVYAATRVLVTRTDSGHSTLNAPLLLGFAGPAAMTPLYYPQINRNFKDVASGYGGSLGGAALGFFVTEFSDSFLHALHIGKKP